MTAGVLVLSGILCGTFPAYAETAMPAGPGNPNGPGAPVENSAETSVAAADADIPEMGAYYYK